MLDAIVSKLLQKHAEDRFHAHDDWRAAVVRGPAQCVERCPLSFVRHACLCFSLNSSLLRNASPCDRLSEMADRAASGGSGATVAARATAPTSASASGSDAAGSSGVVHLSAAGGQAALEFPFSFESRLPNLLPTDSSLVTDSDYDRFSHELHLVVQHLEAIHSAPSNQAVPGLAEWLEDPRRHSIGWRRLRPHRLRLTRMRLLTLPTR